MNEDTLPEPSKNTKNQQILGTTEISVTLFLRVFAFPIRITSVVLSHLLVSHNVQFHVFIVWNCMNYKHYENLPS